MIIGKPNQISKKNYNQAHYNMTEILNAQQTKQKIRRIAYELYENNLEETSLVLAAIYPNGLAFATLLRQELQAIMPVEVFLLEIKPDENQQPTLYGATQVSLQDKTVIVVDDVLHTGKTLIYSLKPLLDIPVKKIQTAVLIKREHRLFPIKANYVGYALSTTLKEHINVTWINGEPTGVFLF